nr:hypothetical protein [Azospirillum sp. 412522]
MGTAVGSHPADQIVTGWDIVDQTDHHVRRHHAGIDVAGLQGRPSPLPGCGRISRTGRSRDAICISEARLEVGL